VTLFEFEDEDYRLGFFIIAGVVIIAVVGFSWLGVYHLSESHNRTKVILEMGYPEKSEPAKVQQVQQVQPQRVQVNVK